MASILHRLLILASFMVSFCYAAEQITWGFESGVNFASVGKKNFDNTPYKNRLRLMGGVTTEFPLPVKGLSLQPSLQYVQKGSTIGSGGIIIKLDYLELPVLLKVRFSRREKIRPILLGGLAVGLNVVAQACISDTCLDYESGSIPIKSIEGSLILGGGLEFLVSERFAISVGARHSWGLTEFSKAGFTNRGLQFLVGFQFGQMVKDTKDDRAKRRNEFKKQWQQDQDQLPEPTEQQPLEPL